MDKSTIILSLYFAGIMFFIGTLCYSYHTSIEDRTMEGTIIDVDATNDKYMVITFDNGESYNVGYDLTNPYLDFTVNSKMIVKLQFSETWIRPNTDNIWGITQIIKVPSEGDK